ncbi:MAG: lasso peptide biosynthesis B2 protein [Erythrobacter sp.]
MSAKRSSAASIALRKARTAISLPLATIVLAAMIWMLLWMFTLLTFAVPIRHLSRFLGADRGLDDRVEAPQGKAFARVEKLATAMDLAVRYHPLTDTCYAEALIAHMFLLAMSVEHVIKFGVRRKAEGPNAAIEAHAWLMAGSTTVCGGRRNSDYTVVRCFLST